MSLLLKQILLVVTLIGFSRGEVGEFPLLMPNALPQKPETYFCTPVRLDWETDYYIIGFRPNASMDTAHHMLLYGCSEPGKFSDVYNCGDMAAINQGVETGPVCKSGPQVIYAWAKNAPKLELPPGVGFHVGGRSSVKYLVLQVHYASVDRFKDGRTRDDSGVFIRHTDQPQPKAAGVLLMGTGGMIPGKSVEYMETACNIDEDKVIHPFAFRTHTHALGRVVSGYRVQANNGKHEWTLIGKMDPQLPQMFYPVANNMTITRGDTVAARCTMENRRTGITWVGPTANDEMCNFYMMYWTSSRSPLSKKVCMSAGPPFFYWRRFPLRNIPNKDASVLLERDLQAYYDSIEY